jgi:hypothetical protein
MANMRDVGRFMLARLFGLMLCVQLAAAEPEVVVPVSGSSKSPVRCPPWPNADSSSLLLSRVQAPRVATLMFRSQGLRIFAHAACPAQARMLFDKPAEQWMNTDDDCDGFRPMNHYKQFALAVAAEPKFDRNANYLCPVPRQCPGRHQPSPIQPAISPTAHHLGRRAHFVRHVSPAHARSHLAKDGSSQFPAGKEKEWAAGK